MLLEKMKKTFSLYPYGHFFSFHKFMNTPHGFLLVYKPKGISSFDVIRIARKHLNTKKIGHAGTLDPLAEGLMLLGVNGGTKALAELILSKKSYKAEITFGIRSTTGDEEGEKTSVPLHPFTKEEFENILPKFLGKIWQTPPVYSALKINGKRACDRVRNGETVEIKPREIEIFQLFTTGLKSEGEKLKAEIFVECSSGTYIRSLVEDLGKAMGTSAYMSALVRESLDGFLIKDACLPEEICWEKVQKFLPEHFGIPGIEVTEEEKKELFFGRTITVGARCPVPLPPPQKCTIFYNGEFLGFGEVENGELQPRKLIAL